MSDSLSSTPTSRARRPSSGAEQLAAVETPGRARRLWSVLPVGAAFAVFGLIVWLAYQDASLGPPIGEPPLIKAAAEPIKQPPEQVQDTSLAEQGAVGRLWSDAEQPDQPERLLPPPETPLSAPAIEQPAFVEQTREQPALAEQTPEQPPAQSASGPAAETAAPEAAPEGSETTVAGPSSDVAAAAPPPTPDTSLQEAEAALDRLLAEVTALSESTDPPEVDAAAPVAEQGATEAPPQGAESPPSAPATTAAAAPDTERAAPAAPPQKPASPARAATAETSTEVRPAGAITGAPAPEPSAAARPSTTAALSETAAPIAPLPVVPNGEFRIQLAAVRGEADARRAWNLFLGDLGPVLRTVEPIFERAETENGVFYRVQIGPFASQETAESLCEQLKQRNASCFVIRR